MSNIHAKAAQRLLDGVHEWQSEEGLTDATNIAAALDAQVEATLALAYEQRTANLIAALQSIKLPDSELHPTRSAAIKVLTEVHDRLGIESKELVK